MKMSKKNTVVEGEKNPAAVALGKLGGQSRAQRLSKERRSEIARIAIQARWEKLKEKQT